MMKPQWMKTSKKHKKTRKPVAMKQKKHHQSTHAVDMPTPITADSLFF